VLLLKTAALPDRVFEHVGDGFIHRIEQQICVE
jgi:hypothetical protein